MKFYSLGFILCSFFIPQTSWAIINVSQSVTGAKENGLTNELELGIDGAKGNTEKNNYKGNFSSTWKHGDFTDFLLFDRAYGKSSGVVNTDRLFIHLRHRKQFNDTWAYELFAQTGRDAFTRLTNRTLLGAGYRATLDEEEKVSSFYVGLGAFYEKEKLSPKVGATDAESKAMRGNFYALYKQQITAQVMVSSTTYMQPVLSYASDFRFLEQAALHVGLFKNMKIKISLDYSFDSRPPQTVKRDDLRYNTGFEFIF